MFRGRRQQTCYYYTLHGSYLLVPKLFVDVLATIPFGSYQKNEKKRKGTCVENSCRKTYFSQMTMKRVVKIERKGVVMRKSVMGVGFFGRMLI